MSAPDPPEPDYRLTLRPLPDEVPAPVRLRRLLKAIRRAYGFACRRVETVRPEATQTSQTSQGTQTPKREPAP